MLHASKFNSLIDLGLVSGTIWESVHLLKLNRQQLMGVLIATALKISECT